MVSLLTRKKNDQCALIRVPNATTTSTSLGEALITKRIDEVDIPRSVIFTNKSYNELKGQTLGEYDPTATEMGDQGTLFCRRKYIQKVDVRKNR